MEAKRKSVPRFQRPSERPGINLTKDDYEILMHVYRNRLMESTAIYKLFPDRSAQVISRRLKLLFHTQHLDRPISQNIKNRLKPGTDPYVYAISKNGAAALRAKFGTDVSPTGWRYKNNQLTAATIEHQLEASRFMSILYAAVQQRPGLELLYFDQIVSPERATKRPAGLVNTIRADVAWPVPGNQVGTAPDIVLGLQKDGQYQVLFIEIDRGTETIEPSDRNLRSTRFWRDTSFLRKLLIYGAAFRSKAHHQQFGIPSFRVVTIVPTADRVSTIQSTWERHMSTGTNRTKPGLFLFSNWSDIAAADDLLAMPFENAVGKPVYLLD